MVRQPSAPRRPLSVTSRVRLSRSSRFEVSSSKSSRFKVSKAKSSKPQPLTAKSPERRSKLSAALRVAVLAITGFVSALVLWELILRFAVEASQGVEDHPALGKIDRPGEMLHTREGFSRTQLNTLGMRGPEPTPKRLGEYRILLLGDSFTRADEVSDGIGFGDRLQAHFTREYEKSNPVQDSAVAPILMTNSKNRQVTEKVSVINAGKPSASPAGYLYAADFHQQTFAPDATVIQITEHDFARDMGSKHSEFYLEKKGAGDYEVRHNQDFGSADPLAQTVIDKFPQVRSLFTLSSLRIGGRNLNAAISSTHATAEVDPALPDPEFAEPVAEDAIMIDWTLQQLNQTFPNVIIVFIPSMNYQDAGPISSLPRNAAIEKTLTESAAAQGIPLINMREDFRNHYAEVGTHLKGFSNTLPGEGHLNSRGHQLVTRRLIDFFNQPDSPLRQS